jgi:hypothetical protein
MGKRIIVSFVLLAGIFFLASCAGGPASPTLEPTQSPTETVVATLTPEATATITPTLDPYPIDPDKVNKIPENIQYLRAHPEEFIQAPDPMVEGVDAFKNWYGNRFVPALGDPNTRVANIFATSMSYGGDEYVHCSPSCKFDNSEVGFFFFISNGVIYPVYSMTVSWKGKSGIVSVIIVDGFGMHGLNTMDFIASQGDPDFVEILLVGGAGDYTFSDDVRTMLNSGMGYDPYAFPSHAMLGFGAINFVVSGS